MNNRLQRFLVPVIGALLLITPITAIFAQTGANILSGTVTDPAGGKLLTGVSVFLNNTSRGTATDAAGSFILKDIPPGKYQLLFSATIVYQDSSRLLPPQESVIRLITPAMVFLEANGNYYPPQEIPSSGFWGQSEKIANLLPLDYNE